MARFALYIWNDIGEKVAVVIKKASANDLELTTAVPKWQTNWTSDYITKSGFDLYALKTEAGELIALGAYEIQKNSVVVHIIYMESQAQSNPTLTKTPKYRGIGKAMIAFGIKISVDEGFNGDVILGAKTPELARHYERDFDAMLLPRHSQSAAPRYLICDEAAQRIFTDYLEE